MATNALWGHYYAVRDRLAKQYRQPMAPDSGLAGEELLAKARQYLAADGAGKARIIQRAEILHMLLSEAALRVDVDDCFADHIDCGRVMWKIQQEWQNEAGKKLGLNGWRLHDCAFGRLDLSHTSPGWRNVLKYGATGLGDRARSALATARDAEAVDFFHAVAIVSEAMRVYILRLAAEAERVGAQRVITTLRALAKKPPRSLYEALQWAFLFNQVQEIEGEYVRSQGVFDQLFYPYYEADLRCGRLTREQAKELIYCFFDKFAAQNFGAGNNICFGGRDAAGNDLCNDLTRLCLEIFAERKMVDPKLSLRVHRNSPQDILLQATDAVRNSANAIVFANDDIAFEMFTRHGKQPEDIVDFVPIGCYEPAIMGKELSCSMSALCNMAKPFEELMASPLPPPSMAELLRDYEDILARHLRQAMAEACAWELVWPQVNPSPVLSASMDACFAKGRDVSAAGAEYNTSGIMCAGIGTVADSLAAIEYLIFTEKCCSWQELRQALADNWQGHDELWLRARQRAPKWGNNDARADYYAMAIAHSTSELINNTPNKRGGHFQMGCWSIDHSLYMGEHTAATPDGRRDGEPLAKNSGATIGMDKKGVTGLINSVSKLDATKFPNGTVLDVMLHPTLVRGATGHNCMVDILTSFCRKGGFYIHFNVFDAETLKAAQATPEHHANLQVRVCGWNARFIDLSKPMQDCFIREAEAGAARP
jgi:pyruvate-formate lyase